MLHNFYLKQSTPPDNTPPECQLCDNFVQGDSRAKCKKCGIVQVCDVCSISEFCLDCRTVCFDCEEKVHCDMCLNFFCKECIDAKCRGCHKTVCYKCSRSHLTKKCVCCGEYSCRSVVCLHCE